MQIADCFIFYNELKMLDYRLHVLNHVVDYFILVEATHTHVGNPKPLFFQENKELFAPYLHKIIHIVVDDFPPSISCGHEHLVQFTELFHYSRILKAISKICITIKRESLTSRFSKICFVLHGLNKKRREEK